MQEGLFWELTTEDRGKMEYQGRPPAQSMVIGKSCKIKKVAGSILSLITFSNFLGKFSDKVISKDSEARTSGRLRFQVLVLTIGNPRLQLSLLHHATSRFLSRFHAQHQQ